MPQDFSFDVVSKVNLQEVANAVHQASREIGTRFDFRGSVSMIEWNEKDLTLTLISEDDHKLRSVVDILEGKLVKRGVPVKALDFGKVEPAAGGASRLLLKPRSPRPDLAWLRVTVAADGTIGNLSYEDASGNRSEFRFETWRKEKARPAADFRITGPPGTRVLEN